MLEEVSTDILTEVGAADGAVVWVYENGIISEHGVGTFLNFDLYYTSALTCIQVKNIHSLLTISAITTNQYPLLCLSACLLQFLHRSVLQ